MKRSSLSPFLFKASFAFVLVILAIILNGSLVAGVEEGPVSGKKRPHFSDAQLKAFEKKGDAGDIEALRCLDVYYFGIHEEQVRLARKGAKLGDVEFRWHLYLHLMTHENPKDRAEGLNALRQAAEQDHFQAQAELARLYRTGKGVKKDVRLSEKWHKEAARQGDTGSMLEVAKLIKDRASKLSMLSEAYGWTLLILKRTTEERSRPFIDIVQSLQRSILAKAKKASSSEDDLLHAARTWAENNDKNIPMTDPVFSRVPGCKYLEE
jgi:TPR repeat protein